MFYWSIVFLVVAVLAAALGFSGIASTSSWMAQVVFLIALCMFALSAISQFARRADA